MNRRLSVVFLVVTVALLGLIFSRLTIVSAQTATATPTSDPTMPDLIVSGLTWTPTRPQLGQQVTFSVTIKNNGGVASPAGVIHDVRVSMSGVSFETVTSTSYTQSLAPGAFATIPVTWFPTIGADYTISASVDVGMRITEGNESNNSVTSSTMILLKPTAPAPTWTKTLTPTPNINLPELNVLSITEYSYSLPTPTPNAQGCWSGTGPIKGLRVRIQNSGPTAAGSFILLLETNGSGYQSAVNSLAAGQILDVDFTPNSLGRVRTATVDFANQVAESNETNNVLTVDLGPATPTSTGSPRPTMCVTKTPTPTSTIGTPSTLTRTPTRTFTPTIGPSLTPTLTPAGVCSPVTSTITIPFTFDGPGVFCWQASALGSFINNWNNNSVTLNGVNVTNIWMGSGSYPAKIGGFYYISYNASFAFSHFESKP